MMAIRWIVGGTLLCPLKPSKGRASLHLRPAVRADVNRQRHRAVALARAGRCQDDEALGLLPSACRGKDDAAERRGRAGSGPPEASVRGPAPGSAAWDAAPSTLAHTAPSRAPPPPASPGRPLPRPAPRRNQLVPRSSACRVGVSASMRYPSCPSDRSPGDPHEPPILRRQSRRTPPARSG